MITLMICAALFDLGLVIYILQRKTDRPAPKRTPALMPDDWGLAILPEVQ